MGGIAAVSGETTYSSAANDYTQAEYQRMDQEAGQQGPYMPPDWHHGGQGGIAAHLPTAGERYAATEAAMSERGEREQKSAEDRTIQQKAQESLKIKDRDRSRDIAERMRGSGHSATEVAGIGEAPAGGMDTPTPGGIPGS